MQKDYMTREERMRWINRNYLLEGVYIMVSLITFFALVYYSVIVGGN